MASKIRILVVDDNNDMRRLMVDFFANHETIECVGSAASGVEALELLQKVEPDIMVLDLIMPQMDGYGVLERMQTMQLAKKTEVIVLTALGRDDFIMRAVDYGARYYMIKPFDINVLAQRITEICQRERQSVVKSIAPPKVNKSLDEKIANMFLVIGIPAHIKGYQYLREAVKLVVEHNEMINSITKELYPGIAKRFGTSSSKVERAIRHAIEVAWNRGRLETINELFGYKVFAEEYKPTNGEFIAVIADKLNIERTA